MKKRFAGMLLLAVLLALVPAMASAALYSKEAYIDDVLLVNGANTDKYSYTQDDEGNAELTLKAGVTVGKIEIGNLNMTIKPQNNVTVTGGISTGIKNTGDNSAWSAPPLIISGGTLTTKYIEAKGGLSINNGAHVTAVNDSGSAIFVTGTDKHFGVYGGSTLIARTTYNTEAVYLLNLWNAEVSGESQMIVSGFRGIRVNDQYNDEITLTISNGSTLDVTATGTGQTAYTIGMEINSDHIGTVRLLDTSVIKLRAENADRLLNCKTDFTPSYEWKTSEGSSAQLHPYENCANQSSYTYLEVQPNKVFVPKISPENQTITYGESQTFTISSANDAPADGITYQWYLDGDALIDETGSSCTVSNLPIKNRYTVSCQVRRNGVGPVTVSSKLDVLAIDASSAEITNLNYTFYDTFNPVVTLGGKELVRGTDYDLNTSNPFLIVGSPITLLPDEFSITVNFKGIYTGSKTAKLNVNAANLADCTVTCGQDTFQYDGQGHIPQDITLTYNGYPLSQPSWDITGDYSTPPWGFEYTPGSYDYTLEANQNNSGKFRGSKTIKFTITKATMTAEKVNLAQQKFTYGDTFTKPESLTWKVPGIIPWEYVMTLADGDYTLPAGRVGDVTNNARATLTFTDQAEYCTGDLEFSYKVNPKEIADSDVTINASKAIYTGSDLIGELVTVDVLLGNDSAATSLVMDRDFTVTAKDANGNPVDKVVSIGNYTLTIEGTGNYTGEVTKAVTVTKANLADITVAMNPASFVYNGSSQVPAVEYNGSTLPASEYDAAYLDKNGKPVSNPTNAGKYTVVLTAKNVNFTGSTTAEFEIKPATPYVDLEKLTFTYGDRFTKPEAFMWNGMILRVGVDYIPPSGRVGNVTEHAVAQMTFRGNYEGTMDFAYEIKPKTIPEDAVFLSGTSFVYDRTDHMPHILVGVILGNDSGRMELTRDTDYVVTVTDQNGQTVTEMKDAGKYTIKVKGLGNFDGEVTKTCTVTQSATTLTATLGSENESPVLYKEYTYGEEFTVTAAAEPSGAVSRILKSVLFAKPAARQMALFLGDQQITEPVNETDGKFVMTYDTSGQALEIGSNEIIAKYVGDANMADQFAKLTVYLKQKELTVESITAKSRAYEPGNNRVAVTSITVSGILDGNKVAVDMDGLTAKLASENVGIYAEATLDDPVKLTGGDAAYYFAAGDAEPVTGGVKITQATPQASGSSDTNGDGVSETDPVFSPVYLDGRTLGSVPLSLPHDAYNVPGRIEWADPADTVIEEGKAYTWIFTPDSPNYSPVTGCAIIYPIGDPPVIISPKENLQLSRSEHSSVQLSIEATDALSYQWYVNDGSGFRPIHGETKPTLELNGLTLSQTGFIYHCVASNLYGDTVSPTFTLLVYPSLPDTGDHSNLMLWGAILMLCSAGILTARRKREN